MNVVGVPHWVITAAVAAVTVLLSVTGVTGQTKPAEATKAESSETAVTKTEPAQAEPKSTAGCDVPASLIGKDLVRIPTDRKVVALTFDAGANGDGVPSILSTLRQADVPGTFFLTGAFVRDYPELTEKIAERYPVGNHSFSHPEFPKLSDEEVRSEIGRTEKLIENVAGNSPRPYFRFPFGARDARTLGLVNQACYAAFRWTVDTVGWKGTSGGATVDSVTERALKAATPGEIVLMHVGSHPQDKSTLDADALPRIISGLRERGYGFVTLPQVLPKQ